MGLQSMFDMTKRVAVVTGAAGLLGVKHCEALAEAGANVICLDIDAEGARELAKRLCDRFGTRCVGIGCDIADHNQVDQALIEVMSLFGKVDALVNNARRPYQKEELLPFEEFSMEVLRKDFRVQIEGAIICTQKLGAQMVKQRYGSIVNICSTYGIVGPDQRIYEDEAVSTGTPVSYSVVKSALVGLTRYLASYWGPVGVRVNLLTPGGIRREGRQTETFLRAYEERVPMRRMAMAGEMKGAIVFLCSDASSYMTGANLVIDGGWTAW